METAANRSRRLLERQLRKAGLSADAFDEPKIGDLLSRIETTYEEFERQRRLVHRSTELASEELSAMVASLSASEKLFRSLARCSPNAIIYTDNEGRCLYANRRAEDLSGSDAADLSGYGWLGMIVPEDRHYFENFDAGQFSDQAADWVAEHRVVSPNGDLIWVSTRIAGVDQASEERLRSIGCVVNIEQIHERKMYEHELSRLASLDNLTQLANRYSLSKQLAEAMSKLGPDERLAAAAIDLDRFKLINDTFGHVAGDSLLVEVAAKLRKVTKADDIVARIGGDEFIVITKLLSGDRPEVFAAAISDELHGPVYFDGRTIQLTSSVGVALASSAETSEEEFLRDADTAMYRAKRSSVVRWEIFDNSFRAEATIRYLVEGELRQAVEGDEISLAYRPIADADTGKVVSLEAGGHWSNPRIGAMPASDFIPIVQELGLITILGGQLLNRGCRKLRQWRTLPSLRQLTLSFDTSAGLLNDPEFSAMVRRTLSKNNLPADALVLEVDEEVIVQHLESSFEMINELRSIGVSIAVRNFGSGASSLSFLDRLPVDFLKIDESFVQAMGEDPDQLSANRLAVTMVELALRFGFKPIATGLESEYQRRALRSAGCSLFQGPLIADSLIGDDQELSRLLVSPAASPAPIGNYR